jgi:putative flippase GtrA
VGLLVLGPELLRYAVLVAVSWLVTVGVTSGLAALGTPYVAQVAATMVIAVLNYAGYRWFVFCR